METKAQTSQLWWIYGKGLLALQIFNFSGVLHLFERLFEIGWENNGNGDITMPLSLKTIDSAD